MAIVKQYKRGKNTIEAGWIPKDDKGHKQWYVSTTDTTVKDASVLSGDIIEQPNKSHALKTLEYNAERMGFKSKKKVRRL